ncbi:hypothetical protein G9A89_005509 [Geosiphon pyriformis]|nr:hypothetical protein G9A89_005509 [Geosiphon pyriformis]
MDNYKTKVQAKLSGDGDERFRLYCEKVLTDFYHLIDVNPTMSRKIGERKHIVYQVFSIQSINNQLTLYALSMLPDGYFLVTELATATIPFSFNARSQYKAVLRMMAIFHDEMIKQEALTEKINQSVLRTKETKVRDVLRMPELE